MGCGKIQIERKALPVIGQQAEGCQHLIFHLGIAGHRKVCGRIIGETGVKQEGIVPELVCLRQSEPPVAAGKRAVLRIEASLITQHNLLSRCG